MRYSKQKEFVLKTVQESCNHPDAKDIYMKVKKKIPNISLGTVYRNLNILSDEGLIKKVLLENGNDRFDKTIVNHNHVYCEGCGKLVDISLNINQNDIKNIEKETCFKITDSNFNIKGLCSKCIKERNK